MKWGEEIAWARIRDLQPHVRSPGGHRPLSPVWAWGAASPATHSCKKQAYVGPRRSLAEDPLERTPAERADRVQHPQHILQELQEAEA